MSRPKANLRRALSVAFAGGLAALIGTPEALEAAGNASQPNICNRSCWNARSAVYRDNMPSLNRAMIHHTAGTYMGTSLSDSKAQMRSIQNYHMDNNGWDDIGYGFVADNLGNIFEAMRGALTRIPRGIHDGVNDRSMGFCLMGYFHSPYNQNPTSAGRNAIYDVIAWKMPNGWVGPYGSGTYNSRTVGWVDGHRNARGTTSCPGDVFFNNHITNNYSSGEARHAINDRIVGGGGQKRIDTIARGASNRLYHKYWEDGSGWSGFSNLGQDARSAPAIASWGSDRLDVFFRRSDDALGQLWSNNGGGSWSSTSLGGTLDGGVDAVSWGSGRLDVVVRGTNDRLYWKSHSSGWSGFTNLNVTATSDPAISSMGSDSLDVFFRGASGDMEQTWWRGDYWRTPISHGGTLVGAPTAVSVTTGRVDVVVPGTNNRLYWKHFVSGSGWSGYSNLNVHATSDPGIASWDTDRLDVFYRGSNDELLQVWTNNGGSSWSGPADLSGTLTSGPDAVGSLW